MDANKLLVEAEEVNTGNKIIGYVCCCKNCSTRPYGEPLSLFRPYGLLTAKDGMRGNILVYTDTMRFVNDSDQKEDSRIKRTYVLDHYYNICHEENWQCRS